MACDKPVIVDPPSESGGRRVRVNGQNVGVAHSLHDLTVFLQHAGLEGWDDLDVAASDLIVARRQPRGVALNAVRPPRECL